MSKQERKRDDIRATLLKEHGIYIPPHDDDLYLYVLHNTVRWDRKTERGTARCCYILTDLDGTDSIHTLQVTFLVNYDLCDVVDCGGNKCGQNVFKGDGEHCTSCHRDMTMAIKQLPDQVILQDVIRFGMFGNSHLEVDSYEGKIPIRAISNHFKGEGWMCWW